VPENYFDEPIARGYDASTSEEFEPAVIAATVEFLADLAGSGAALEFAIGTGRIALPLSGRGVPVHGIDLSPEMIAQLRAKPGADAINVAIGDIARTKLDRTFSLVYLVYNTIGNLVTQDAQVECFCNAAAHLEPGGCFVIEVLVPELQRLPPGETVRPFLITEHHLGFDEMDVTTQQSFSHHYFASSRGFERWSMPWRYVWPSELDLMARIASMKLRERWSDWDRAPFTRHSRKHISVWEKPLA
jgi:SAM-dependent methyltransferase